MAGKRTHWLAAVLFAVASGRAAAADSEPADFAGMLDAHNAVRAAAGTPPLVWSAAAQRQAQGWADQLARENCALRYNPDPGRREQWGENILNVRARTPYSGFKRTPEEVVGRWAEESAWYDYASNSCRAPAGRICGSWEQVVWETTTLVGCGRARCAEGEVWVCNYTPRGLQEGLRPWGNPPPPPPPVAAPLACYMDEDNTVPVDPGAAPPLD